MTWNDLTQPQKNAQIMDQYNVNGDGDLYIRFTLGTKNTRLYWEQKDNPDITEEDIDWDTQQELLEGDVLASALQHGRTVIFFREGV